MKVGVPKELKNHEYRVAITPAGVHELSRAGHQVFTEEAAGTGRSRVRKRNAAPSPRTALEPRAISTSMFCSVICPRTDRYRLSFSETERNIDASSLNLRLLISITGRTIRQSLG